MSEMVHTTSISVRFYELDPYGHLNHSVYIQYFETGRIDMFKAMGWSLTQMADLGTRVVVVSIETKFLGAGVEGDELVVETWVEDVKRVSMLFGQQILRGEDVLATQQVMGACTTTDGRPVRLPGQLRSGLSMFVRPDQ